MTWRTAAALSTLTAFAIFGGLSACSKKVEEQTSTTVESATSDIGAGISSVAADMDTQKTQDFVQKAAVANLFEIQSSQLAQEKSKSKAVLAFADQMIDDHGKAAVKFDAAVAKSGQTAPVVLDDDHQKKIDDLKAKTGKDFDDAYIDAQKDAHDDAVDLFDDYSKNGKDPALQTFATETLPTLKMHQDKVKNLKP
ncbi:MAG: DUF4142 domain-containing protein [Asticcacaulis sp.]|nr:DUF4142 domain-containing protein [Asticcacaulis sp.]